MRSLVLLSSFGLAEAMQANPIRKVVNLLEDLKKEVEQESEDMKKLNEKVECTCKKEIPDMQQEIENAKNSVGELQSVIQERSGAVEQLKTEIEGLKKDLDDNSASLKEAQTIRKKEATEFKTESATAKTNIGALDQAIPALRQGMTGSFLQKAKTSLTTLIQNEAFSSDSDRDMIVSAMHGKVAAGSSGEIVGILEQLRENMKDNLIESTKAEEEAVNTFKKLESSKSGEIAAAKKELLEKQNRKAAQDEEKATAQQNLSETQEALADTQKRLAAKQRSCKDAAKEYEQAEKDRQAEILGVQEAIKILNDDDSLELFNKTMKKPSSFVQMKSHQKGKFDKLVKHCKGMIAALKAEQKTEDEEHGRCKQDLNDIELDLTEDKNTAQNTAQAVEQKTAELSQVGDEIKVLKGVIAELNKSVATETDNRKSENAEFTAITSENTQAAALLKKAAAKLKETFGPKKKTFLVQVPHERETFEVEQQDEQTADMLGLSFLQTKQPVSKKMERSQKGGSIVMILMDLTKEIEMEIATLTASEKEQQKDYEEFMAESAKTKKARKDELTTKVSTQAKLKTELEGLNEDKTGADDRLAGTIKEKKGLQEKCEFLLKNYTTRQEGRTQEKEDLERAMAILQGMKEEPASPAAAAPEEEAEALIQKSAHTRRMRKLSFK